MLVTPLSLLSRIRGVTTSASLEGGSSNSCAVDTRRDISFLFFFCILCYKLFLYSFIWGGGIQSFRSLPPTATLNDADFFPPARETAVETLPRYR